MDSEKGRSVSFTGSGTTLDLSFQKNPSVDLIKPPPDKKSETEHSNEHKANAANESELEEKVLRLILHATAIEPNVVIQPSAVELGTISLNQLYKRTLKVLNESLLAIKFKFEKAMHLEIQPKEGWLQSKKSIEVLLVVCPASPGK